MIGFLRAAFVDVRLRPGHGRDARNLVRRAGEKARRLPREARRELAEELRAAGVSYREIATTLNVDYGRVSRWLDGEGEPRPPEPVALSAAPAPPQRASLPGDLDERVARLEARLDRLEAKLARLIH
jgi:hypothetical protein